MQFCPALLGTPATTGAECTIGMSGVASGSTQATRSAPLPLPLPLPLPEPMLFSESISPTVQAANARLDSRRAMRIVEFPVAFGVTGGLMQAAAHPAGGSVED